MLTAGHVGNLFLFSGVQSHPAPPLPPPTPPPTAPPPPAVAAAASAAAAFSVRRLIPAWIGQPVLNVRNGATGATADFFPIYNPSASLAYDLVLSDGATTYASWIGGSTGYVTTWYDQTGARPSLKGENALRLFCPGVPAGASNRRRLTHLLSLFLSLRPLCRERPPRHAGDRASLQPALVAGTALTGTAAIASYALAFLNKAFWMTHPGIAAYPITAWATYMMNPQSSWYTSGTAIITLFGSSGVDLSMRFCPQGYSQGEGYISGCLNNADFLGTNAASSGIYSNGVAGSLASNPKGVWNYMSATSWTGYSASGGLDSIAQTIVAYNRAFDGYIAELAYFPASLSAADHGQLYQQRIPIPPPPSPPPAPPSPPPQGAVVPVSVACNVADNVLYVPSSSCQTLIGGPVDAGYGAAPNWK